MKYEEISSVTEGPKERKGTRRLIAWLIGIAVFLFVADQAIRVWEFNQILNVAEDSEDILNTYEEDLFIAQDRIDLGFDDASVDKAAAQRGREAEAEMLAEAEKLDQIPLLPWHDGLKRVLDDYRAHNSAWVEAARYASIDGDGQVVSPSAIDDINATWEVAIASFKVSLPIFDVANFAQRLIDLEKA